MRKPVKKQGQPSNLKKKLMSALSMLFVATILMTTTSYAWFVLSTAPEVTGISTNVGANGSLEIALLNTQTRSDMSSIRAGIGDSLAANNLEANNAWGNLVDLGFVDYGLGNLLLMPARLNAVASGDGYTVDPGMLAVPTYGYDGRIIDLTDNTVSAIYKNNEFTYIAGEQDYGVRAIGTSDSLTAQSSSLALAKSNITTYTTSAKTNAKVALTNSSGTLFDIYVQHVSQPDEPYKNTDRDALKAILADLKKSLSDIEAALRQGLVAVAASEIEEEALFNQVKDRVMDTSMELKQILDTLSEVSSVPANFASWVEKLDEMQNDLNAASNACDAMTSGAYTWLEVRGVLDYIMNMNFVYIGQDTLENVDINVLLAADYIEMTLAPGSGIFADIVEFIGNYSVIVRMLDMKDVEVKTAYDEEQGVYLTMLSEAVKDLEAAGGMGSGSMELSATYGYALDLAFRCNTEGADLILQTSPKQRVYNQEGAESTAASTQGGGSYMEFSSRDDKLDLNQRLSLMDAIRVGFLNDKGDLLGIAKLNISNYVPGDGVIYAPLYLYDYTFESDETGLFLTMGERKTEANTIVPKEDMEKNVPEAVTVVVWLDGDLVDNTMVSATEAASLNGVLNLQFATSAELVPAQDGALLNYTVDKSGLESLIQEFSEIIAAGRGSYTTVSWTDFFTAYDRAVSVNDSPNVSQTQVRNTMLDLVKAEAALEVISWDPINNKIASLREQMGETEDLVHYVIKDGNGNIITAGTEEHTQQEHDSWDILGEIKRVDYNQNLHNEGNEIYTPIYTNESWSALAGALYEAERLAKDENATDEQLNAALSAIEVSEKALERQVFYRAYEYKGAIYYEAICDAENADTYGKWYDSNFQRIISELMILNLDAYAVPAVVSQIDQNEYISNKATGITPQVEMLDQIYTELQNEEILGIKWNVGENDILVKGADESHITALNNLLAIVEAENLAPEKPGESAEPEEPEVPATKITVDTSAAEDLITRFENKEPVSQLEAETVIENLNNAIIQALEERDKEKTTYMTASQRILLTTAVNAAKAVEGYEENAALKQAAEDAEKKLGEAETTETEAGTALSALNAQLKAAGADEVTEYNTLTHKIPESSDIYDVVYDVEYPGINMNVTGKSGTDTISAKILTKNGVIITVTKNIIVYTPADAVEVLYKGKALDVQTGLELEEGKQAELTTRLFYEEKEEEKAEDTPENETAQDQTGEENTEDTNTQGKVPVNILDQIEVPENIKSFSWASGDTTVATIVGKDAETCTIEALAEGSTIISVSVVTVEGNTYALAIPVTVTATDDIVPEEPEESLDFDAVKAKADVLLAGFTGIGEQEGSYGEIGGYGNIEVVSEENYQNGVATQADADYIVTQADITMFTASYVAYAQETQDAEGLNSGVNSLVAALKKVN